MKAHILHLQRLSTEDGPGIRTTIFFKGCPLSCAWCHNPESIDSLSQLQWHSVRCIGCYSCLPVCPSTAVSKSDQGRILIDRHLCDACGLCVEACPTTALELLGTEIEIKDLVYDLLKDKVYYLSSTGGVTASGGEPTLQAETVSMIFQELKRSGVHTALDTCGYCSQENLSKILPFTDLVLYDLKSMDLEEHIQFTGRSNQRILENLLWIRDEIANQYPQYKLWIRTPLIPGYTANASNLRSIGEFLSRELGSCVERWELCAFNNLCQSKYKRLDMPWNLASTPLLAQIDLDNLGEIARASVPDPGIVFITGTARLPEKLSLS